MKIVYLASAKKDLRWFKQYYMQVFPQGREKADNHFLKTQQAIKENPKIGHPSERVATARELHIHRTPFTFIYRINGDYLEILRVLDGRSGE